jgi:ribosomal protein S18 acetylase RimI-like enzyme
LLKIKKILFEHASNCDDLINMNICDLKYFKRLGWNINQFKLQILKEINYGLGIFNGHSLEGFLLGDLITIEKLTEYEILLIYVSNKRRNLGYATLLLANIKLTLKKKNLKKIFLEVASNNYQAINLYKKNKFIKTGIRKNYYLMDNNKVDAFFFEKIIDE